METKEQPQKEQSKWGNLWTQLQYLVLGLTILGQITVGAAYLAGQGAWCIANLIAVIRDFILHRPTADIVKDSAMLAITIGLIAAYCLGFF